MNFSRLDMNDFNESLKFFKKNGDIVNNNVELYDIYNLVCDLIEEVFNTILIKKYTPINSIIIILYIISELDYYYKTNDFSKDDIKKKLKDDDFKNDISSKIADKYLTNEQLNYKSDTFLNKFNPEISSLSLYFNFILNVLNNLKNLNKYQSLLVNMLINSFNLGKCIENLLIDGFEVEAFSTWRTMHENECIIYCLMRNGKLLFDSYFKHIEYSLAYRLQIKDKEKVDNLFIEIKEKMKKYDLKSKDTKKFIEYGYLLDIPNIKLNEDIKLNFRDGVQKCAGLENYSKVYELSSEVAHSSPLLLFSNKEYYFNITILNLYETFFRLESIYYDLYVDLSSKEEIEAYKKMREIYLKELSEIHDRILNKYQEIKNKE